MLIILYIPFLHFETYNGYERMSRAITKERVQAPRGRQPPPRSDPRSRRSKMRTYSELSEYTTPSPIPIINVMTKVAAEHDDTSSNTNPRKPTTGLKRSLGNSLRDLRGKLRLKLQPKDDLNRSPSATHCDDLERGEGVRIDKNTQKASEEDRERPNRKDDSMVVEENNINNLQEGVKETEKEVVEAVDEE